MVNMTKARRFRLHTVAAGANGQYSVGSDLHWVGRPTFDINAAYDDYMDALRDNMLSVMLEPGRNVPAYEIQHVQAVLTILADDETLNIMRRIVRWTDFSTVPPTPWAHRIAIPGEYILMSCEADNYAIFVTVTL